MLSTIPLGRIVCAVAKWIIPRGGSQSGSKLSKLPDSKGRERASALQNMRILTMLTPTLPLCYACSLTVQAPRPRIAVGGISHESNSFNPAETQLADFERRIVEP